MISQERITEVLWQMASTAIDEFLVAHNLVVGVAVTSSEDFRSFAVSLLSQQRLETHQVGKWVGLDDVRFSPPEWDGYAMCHLARNAAGFAQELESTGFDEAAREISPILPAACMEVLVQARESLEYRSASSDSTFYGLFFHDVTDSDCFRSSMLVSQQVNHSPLHQEMLQYFRATYENSKGESSARIRKVLDDFINESLK